MSFKVTEIVRSESDRCSLTAREADGQAGREKLSLAQILLELLARCIQCSLILSQLPTVLANFLEIIPDLLPVLEDFLFAGSVADIPPQLRSIFSQLFIVCPQLAATLVHFFSRCADVFEVLSNFRLVVMAAVVMTNVTPEVMFVLSRVMALPAAVIAVPPPVTAISSPMLAPFAVIVVSPVLMMAAAVLRIGGRG